MKKTVKGFITELQKFGYEIELKKIKKEYKLQLTVHGKYGEFRFHKIFSNYFELLDFLQEYCKDVYLEVREPPSRRRKLGITKESLTKMLSDNGVAKFSYLFRCEAGKWYCTPPGTKTKVTLIGDGVSWWREGDPKKKVSNQELMDYLREF